MPTIPLCATGFYGPTIHHLNAPLSKVVDSYKATIELEFIGTDTPYLFAQSSSYSKGVSSSQWTAQVVSLLVVPLYDFALTYSSMQSQKAAFFKFSGVSPCPKTLRRIVTRASHASPLPHDKHTCVCFRQNRLSRIFDPTRTWTRN